jgi:hypothetical protein
VRRGAPGLCGASLIHREHGGHRDAGGCDEKTKKTQLPPLGAQGLVRETELQKRGSNTLQMPGTMRQGR